MANTIRLGFGGLTVDQSFLLATTIYVVDRPGLEKGQQHSCRIVSVEEHFERKVAARDLFDHLLDELTTQVGSCEVVSLPCCIHLYGEYEFLAVLPKKARLEMRFALHRQLTSPRVSRSIQISKTSYKHCVDIHATEAIDEEFLGWLRETYHLRDG